jgi:hypothetical protein
VTTRLPTSEQRSRRQEDKNPKGKPTVKASGVYAVAVAIAAVAAVSAIGVA